MAISLTMDPSDGTRCLQSDAVARTLAADTAPVAAGLADSALTCVPASATQTADERR